MWLLQVWLLLLMIIVSVTFVIITSGYHYKWLSLQVVIITTYDYC